MTLCGFIHTTFIGIHFEEDTADYSPFKDLTNTHHNPTLGLAIEELIEAAVWTCIGVTYLTFTQLEIKDSHHETALLKEVCISQDLYHSICGSERV